MGNCIMPTVAPTPPKPTLKPTPAPPSPPPPPAVNVGADLGACLGAAFLVGFFLLRRRRHELAVRNSSLHERLLQEKLEAGCGSSPILRLSPVDDDDDGSEGAAAAAAVAAAAAAKPSDGDDDDDDDDDDADDDDDGHGSAEGGGDDVPIRPFHSTVVSAPSASAIGGAIDAIGGGGNGIGNGIGNDSIGIGESVALAVGAAVTVFSAKDLSRYCAKFTNKVGEGAFGAVYVGTLPSGQRIAVKQMQLAEKKKEKKKAGARVDPYAGEAGFRLELDVLSRYEHPQLVTLLGYCVDKQRKTTVGSIVLEFMTGGSLLKRLDPTSTDPPLTAQERFDVSADVACGLHYLHAEASPPLIHQDVKSDNILLAVVGGRLIAKVADFGTARMAPQLAMNLTHGGGKTHHSTGVIVGTKPYMPAEVGSLLLRTILSSLYPTRASPFLLSPPSSPCHAPLPLAPRSIARHSTHRLPPTHRAFHPPAVPDGGAHLGEDGHLRVRRRAARAADGQAAVGRGE
jgi:hypothetical protein